jgi:hypothetical protein
MYFSACLKCSLLYWSKNVLNESMREKLNTYYVIHIFCISLIVFKMVKQKGVNVLELFHYV